MDQGKLRKLAGLLNESSKPNQGVEHALDQAVNGTHLDKTPNHDDDSLFDIADRINDQWAKRCILAHAKRLQAAHAELKKN